MGTLSKESFRPHWRKPQRIRKETCSWKRTKPNKQTKTAVLADELKQMWKPNIPVAMTGISEMGELTCHVHSMDIYNRGSAGFGYPSESRRLLDTCHLTRDLKSPRHTHNHASHLNSALSLITAFFVKRCLIWIRNFWFLHLPCRLWAKVPDI